MFPSSGRTSAVEVLPLTALVPVRLAASHHAMQVVSHLFHDLLEMGGHLQAVDAGHRGESLNSSVVFLAVTGETSIAIPDYVVAVRALLDRVHHRSAVRYAELSRDVDRGLLSLEPLCMSPGPVNMFTAAACWPAGQEHV